MPIRVTHADFRTIIQSALAALKAGDAAQAAAMLRPPVDSAPGDLFPWYALANAKMPAFALRRWRRFLTLQCRGFPGAHPTPIGHG